jgi:hypothetical protein
MSRDERFDFTQKTWLAFLAETAAALDGKDKEDLRRNLDIAKKCEVDKVERRDGKTVLVKGKPCMSVVCLRCRRRMVADFRNELWRVFGHVPKAELRMVELHVPQRATPADLEHHLYRASAAASAFIKAGSEWRSHVSRWGGGYAPRWWHNSEHAAFRITVRLMAHLRDMPDLERLREDWRACLVAAGLRDQQAPTIARAMTIVRVTNRKTTARWASNYDEPFPASTTKMPGPAFIAYFDNAVKLHAVLGRRTFPRFRRSI